MNGETKKEASGSTTSNENTSDDAEKQDKEQQEQLMRETQKKGQQEQLEREKQNSATADNMSKGTIGAIENFDKEDDWTQWQERLDQFFVVNEKKVPLLLTLIGKKGCALLRNLCIPDAPSTKTYQQLTQLMKNHLQPAPSEIVERYNFKGCIQKESESVKSFCARLKQLAMHCSFGTELTNNLRDQFVCGIRCESTKKRLLGEKDLTFDKAIQLATGMEMASRDAAGMSTTSMNNAASINNVKGKQRQDKEGAKKDNNSKNNSAGKACFYCAFVRTRDAYAIGFSEPSSITCESTVPSPVGEASQTYMKHKSSAQEALTINIQGVTKVWKPPKTATIDTQFKPPRERIDRRLRNGADPRSNKQGHLASEKRRRSTISSGLGHNRVRARRSQQGWRRRATPRASKNNSPSTPSDTRPIAQLPEMAKVLERIVHGQFLSHLTANGLLDAHQFGFRPGRSTQTAILDLTESIRQAIDKRKVSMIVSFDFSKAFDTIPHSLLIEKLRRIGCAPPTLDTMGPITPNSFPDNKRWILILVDDFSRYAKIYCMTNKSESGECLEKFLRETRNLRVAWRSKKQTLVTRSTCGAEYYAMSEACQEIISLEKALRDMIGRTFYPVVVQSEFSSRVTDSRTVKLSIGACCCLSFAIELPRGSLYSTTVADLPRASLWSTKIVRTYVTDFDALLVQLRVRRRTSIFSAA
ncbi:unnamed protein product [Trichogramma brassicae]|uniref:Reverse transcriptase domain-containing protein n=1 Tax=Trichogramma brassicae TaxID=86971 RepID=A0A6H5I4Q5_9HYME|nr:unnamed protein product [Trichogramma brassicae]